MTTPTQNSLINKLLQNEESLKDLYEQYKEEVKQVMFICNNEVQKINLSKLWSKSELDRNVKSLYQLLNSYEHKVKYTRTYRKRNIMLSTLQIVLNVGR